MALITNLLAYYKLDEASGAAQDAHSVGPYPLTDNGANGTATGKLNGARVLNGASGYFSQATNFLNGLSAFSVSIWVYNTAATNAYRVDNVFATDNGAGTGVSLKLNGAATGAIYTFGKGIAYGGASATANAAMSVNTWYHLLGTVSTSGVVTLYVNGTAQTTTGTGATGAMSNSSPLVVGANPTGANSFFKGSVDEMGVWSREITAAEAVTLYGSGTPPAYSTFGGAADVTPPVVASAAVNAAGTTLTVNLTETGSPPVLPASGATGFTLSTTGAAVTLSSPAISGTTYTATISRAIQVMETLSLAYAPGNVTDSATTPNSMAAASGVSVTNGSTLGAATTYALTGPSTGLVGSATSNYTVAVTGYLGSSVVVTPVDGGKLGTFGPTTATLASGSNPSATFVYTPLYFGSISITSTNAGGLTPPAAIAFTSTLPSVGAAGARIIGG